MADTPQQAAVRRQLAERAGQVSTRIPAGATTPEPKRASQPPATLAPRRPGSTGTRTRRPPSTPPARVESGGSRRRRPMRDTSTGPGGGRRSTRTQPPPAEDVGPKIRRYVERQAGKQFRAVPRTLVAEWLAALVIVIFKPYEPATPNQASEATVPQLIAVSGVYFVLALLASMSPRAQRVANLFGALVDLALLLRNHGAVTAAITSVTKPTGQAPPDVAPSLAPGETPPGGPANPILPTPTGQPSTAQQFTQPMTSAQQLAQANQVVTQALSGWRGIFPTPATASGAAGLVTGQGGRITVS